MKKCPGCKRDIDKHGIACQYCARVKEENRKKGGSKKLSDFSGREFPRNTE